MTILSTADLACPAALRSPAKRMAPSWRTANPIAATAPTPREHQAISNAAALHEFLRKAAYYHGLPRYDILERNYKLRLAHDLKEAAEAMATAPAEALALFNAAIKSPDDNLITWRDQARLIGWIRSDSQARAALLRLWDTNRPLDTRLRAVEAALHKAGLTQGLLNQALS